MSIIGQTERVGREMGELADDFRGVRGRQQTDAAADKAGGESHRELIPIDAHIEHMSAAG